MKAREEDTQTCLGGSCCVSSLCIDCGKIVHRIVHEDIDGGGSVDERDESPTASFLDA